MTTDHYELLGVMPNASKDEIRAAYRAGIEDADTAHRAELNRAWNVLSDPVQRQRYDDALAAGESGEDIGAPARRTTGARRGSDSVPEVVDAPEETAAAPAAGNRRPPLVPTVVLPSGMRLAEKKARGYSIAFDVGVLLVIMLACQFLVPGLVSSDYSKYRDIAQDQQERVDKAQDRIDDANDERDEAEDALRRAQRNDNVEAEAAAQEQLETARDDAREATRTKEAAEKARDDAASELQTPFLVASGVAFVLCLLYTVPMSVMTGQTVGKRMRRIWLVNVDGSRARFWQVFVHYVFPIAVALAIPQLGAIAALAIVLWSLRDRNGQGVHDKIARTLVVDTPPADLKKEA